MNYGPHHFSRLWAWLLLGLAFLQAGGSVLGANVTWRINNVGSGVVNCQLFANGVWKKTSGVGPGISQILIGDIAAGQVLTTKYGGTGVDFSSPESHIVPEGSGNYTTPNFTVSSDGEVPVSKYLKVRTCNGSAVNQSYSVVINNIVSQTFSLKPGECDERVLGPYPSNQLPSVQVVRTSVNPDGTVNNEVESNSTAGDWGNFSDGSGSSGLNTADGGTMFPAYGSSDEPEYVPPVDFGGSEMETGLAKEKTLQHVGNSLYSALGQGFSETINTGRKIDASVQQLKGRLDTANNNLQLVWSRIGDVNTTITVVGGKIDSVVTHTANTATKLDGVNTRLDNNGAKLNSMDTSLGDIRANTATANGHLTDVKGNTLATKDAVNASTNHMGTLAGKLTAATNLLDGIKTNQQRYSLEMTNQSYAEAQGSAGATAASTHTNNLMAVMGPVSTTGANIAATTLGDYASFFELTFRGRNFSVNPLNVSVIATAQPWFRGFVNWALCMVTVMACWKITLRTLQHAGSWQQVKGLTEQTPVLGTISAIGSGLLFRVIIGVALAAIPAFFVSWTQQNASIFSVLGGNPLAGMPPGVAACTWLFDKFVPVVTMVGQPVVILSYSAILGTIIFSKQMIIRFLPS